MTYTPPRRELHVEFEEGHMYEGAEVTLSLDIPFALLCEMWALDELTGQPLLELIKRFGDEALIDWNLGITADGEGLAQQPFAFVIAIVSQLKNLQGLDAPLVGSSPGITGLAQASSVRTAARRSSPTKRRAR